MKGLLQTCALTPRAVFFCRCKGTQQLQCHAYFQVLYLVQHVSKLLAQLPSAVSVVVDLQADLKDASCAACSVLPMPQLVTQDVVLDVRCSAASIIHQSRRNHIGK